MHDTLSTSWLGVRFLAIFCDFSFASLSGHIFMRKIFNFCNCNFLLPLLVFPALGLPLVFWRLLFKLCIQKCRSHLGEDRRGKGWKSGVKWGKVWKVGKVCQRLASHCGFSA